MTKSAIPAKELAKLREVEKVNIDIPSPGQNPGFRISCNGTHACLLPILRFRVS